jgi:tRNA threonylcarbamoyladenosine biosynthesis protein TsaE
MNRDFFCPDEASVRRLGRALGEMLASGDVIRLEGGLGAGKTTLAKAIACGLGIDPDTVKSPTFSLMNIYEGRETVRHFDLYRLKTAEELAEIGFASYSSEKGVTLVEWSDLFPAALPEDSLTIRLSVDTPGRRLTMIPQGKRYETICREAARAYSRN